MLIYRWFLAFAMIVVFQHNIFAGPLPVGISGDKIKLTSAKEITNANDFFVRDYYFCPEPITSKWAKKLGPSDEHGFTDWIDYKDFTCGNTGLILLTVDSYKNMLNRLAASEIKINQTEKYSNENISMLLSNIKILSDHVDSLTKRLEKIENAKKP